MSLFIRHAKREDTAIVLEMIKGIAEYEKLLNQVVGDASLLERELFDENNAKVLLAYMDDNPVGFALYFYNFSTFKGKKGLYLEDLFVKPKYRGKGVGKQLFDHLINIAKNNNCGRIEWVCLNWNAPAIEFYKKRKAEALNDWTTFRLDEKYF